MNEKTALLTTSQVARRLNLSVERIRQLARSGTLPPDHSTATGRLWLPSTVDAFVEVRRARFRLAPTAIIAQSEGEASAT